MFGLTLIPAIVMLSDDRMAVSAILIALVLVFIAAVRQGTLLDRYLDAVAWLITGLTLSVVVARAVFARGRVTFHQVMVVCFCISPSELRSSRYLVFLFFLCQIH